MAKTIFSDEKNAANDIKNNSAKKHKLLKPLLVILAVVLISGLTGVGVFYWQNQTKKDMLVTSDKEKAAADKSIKDLQKQVSDLQKTQTKKTTTTETETITDFCKSGGSNYKVLSIQHVTNANGDFALCSVGYTDGPTGFVIYAKKINNNWTEIFKGQQNMDSALANQYQIPHSLYMFSTFDDTRPDGVKNWKY